MPTNRIKVSACRKVIYDFLKNEGLDLRNEKQDHLRDLLKGYVQTKTQALDEELRDAQKINRKLKKKIQKLQ